MKVLVVDDSRISRGAIRMALQRAGYEVVEAESGRDALKLIGESSPDLVTLDIGLPGMDGFDVCMRVRAGESSAAARQLPVVFVTANDTLEGRVRGFHVGGADFVTKAHGPETIVAAVNRILRPDRQLQGTVAVVADDSEISRALLCNHLREEGVSVLEAHDGQEALSLLLNRKAEVDLVISDMMMPKMPGNELCVRIREDPRYATVPIIIVSVVDNIESVLDLFRVGATDYMLKPYVKEELVARLNSHLQVRLLNKKLRERLDELSTLNGLKDRFLEVYGSSLSPPLQACVDAMARILERDHLEAQDRQELADIRHASEQTMTLIGNLLEDMRSWTRHVRAEQDKSPRGPAGR